MLKPMNKISHRLKHILEIIWLIVGIIALAIASYETVSGTLNNALPYYAFGAIALFFYFSRRNERRKNTAV
jgi:uncharacterized membrane protein YbaN (DUF454 family)